MCIHEREREALREQLRIDLVGSVRKSQERRKLPDRRLSLLWSTTPQGALIGAVKKHNNIHIVIDEFSSLASVAYRDPQRHGRCSVCHGPQPPREHHRTRYVHIPEGLSGWRVITGGVGTTGATGCTTTGASDRV